MDAEGRRGIYVGRAETIGTRAEQQDAMAFCRGEMGVLCALADGMGGMRGGLEYSRRAVAALSSDFTSSASRIKPHKWLVREFQRLNEYAIKDKPKLGDGGTTLVCALIRARRLTFASVGDSRIALLRSRRLIRLNREHVLGNSLDEKSAAGAISQDDAKYNAFRASVFSCIGAESLNEIDFIIRPVILLPGDVVLLMSDGIFNALSDEEIEAAFVPGAQAFAVELVERVLAKSICDQDNASVIVISI